MFGWEFPPYNSGGLGTACYGLTKGLSKLGTGVSFVIPKTGGKPVASSHVNLVDASLRKHISFKTINSPIRGYITSEAYDKEMHRFSRDTSESQALYGHDLYDEVYRYAARADEIAKEESFDIIHAHDWLTYPAGIAAKEATGKPLVVHVHATEFDRGGGNANQAVYDIEREGMHAADHIIAVSQYTKDTVLKHYGIPEEKVSVVHNAVEFDDHGQSFKVNSEDKLVLFLGRITLQKGPDWFLYAAQRVLQKMNNVRFVMTGSGDMQNFVIEKAAELGIAHKVLFTGFLRGPELAKAYQMADLYVMPSISEPFGITPLEALKNNVPVLISKQSGVSEVLRNALKTDFWDVDQMADKIIAALNHPALHNTLREEGWNEVQQMSWDTPAQKCRDIYQSVVNKKEGRSW